ncbi:calcium-binding protein [Rhodobacter capsulatus]|uniref:Calcium-binding protein n=1 Tax=Rhodobacter capsulatus TaxID=1061 RepID=A0A4U1JPE7_RHOCA|nr:calcium-binding protein [Rhodobacter capsulatus]TKD17713.1 calcium-binding protein [Rhodobacter capsulatus]
MPTSFVTTDSIGTGYRFTYSANGEQLIVLAGATLGSTTTAAIQETFATSLTLSILGTVFGTRGLYLYGDETAVSIAAGGMLYTSQPSPGELGIYLAGTGSSLSNAGTISAPMTIGVLSSGHNMIVNTGRIDAASGVFMNLYSSTGDSFVNSGIVTANAASDAANTTRYNNAVFSEGGNGRITNLAEGELTAMSSDGAGVRLGSYGGGAVVRNFGQITSAQDCGINLELVNAGQGLIRVVNDGTISGGEASYAGSQNADLLLNRGLLAGDVTMGAGQDTLRNVGGTIDGAVQMGDGDDVLVNSGGQISGDVGLGAGADRYDGRSGALDGSVDGGDGDDTFIGNAQAAETFNGGAGLDLLDFRFGAAVTVALDGTFANDGTALGDSYISFENVLGSQRGDVIRGSAGDNSLAGLGGADRIDGAAGNDAFTGGAGADTLTGGMGNDLFRFTVLSDCGDVITDFGAVTGNNDSFRIVASAFGGGLATGTLAGSAFLTRADNLAQDADDRFIFRTTDTTLWFDADGTGAGAAVLVADLQAGATLTSADIMLI